MGTSFAWPDEAVSQHAAPAAPIDDRFAWPEEKNAQPTNTRQAESPVPPPAFQPTHRPAADALQKVMLIGGPSSNPDVAHGFTAGEALSGMASGVANASAVPPLHRLLQKHNVIRPGNLYPGEAKTPAEMAMAGAMMVLGADEGGGAAIPEGAGAAAESAARTGVPSGLTSSPIMDAVTSVIRRFKKGTPVPAEAPLPHDLAGKGTFGTPVDLWGKRVPTPAPVARPIPEAAEAPTAPAAAPATRAIPEFAPEIRRVPSTNEIREELPGAKAARRGDVLEDRAIQQEQAAQLEEQGRRTRSEQLRRDIAGSSTGLTKADLIAASKNPRPPVEVPKGTIQIEEAPVEPIQAAPPKPGRVIPPANEDLTPILAQSVEEARAAKAARALAKKATPKK
jgi:hypothetical protein